MKTLRITNLLSASNHSWTGNTEFELAVSGATHDQPTQVLWAAPFKDAKFTIRYSGSNSMVTTAVQSCADDPTAWKMSYFDQNVATANLLNWDDVVTSDLSVSSTFIDGYFEETIRYPNMNEGPLRLYFWVSSSIPDGQLLASGSVQMATDV